VFTWNYSTLRERNRSPVAIVAQPLKKTDGIGVHGDRPEKKARRSGLPRISPEVDGIQVNFCKKNAACPNFD
jgi:hypothetical protein